MKNSGKQKVIFAQIREIILNIPYIKNNFPITFLGKYSLSENIAFGKPVQISSQLGASYTGRRAVDGNLNGIFSQGGCTHTNTEEDPWLRVDLQQQGLVNQVRSVCFTI